MSPMSHIMRVTCDQWAHGVLKLIELSQFHSFTQYIKRHLSCRLMPVICPVYPLSDWRHESDENATSKAETGC